MHIIQEKLLSLAGERNLADLTLRKIGELVGEPDSPQKIKHHLDKLMEKGLLFVGGGGKVLKPAASGLDKKSKIVSLPIVGSANCGEALIFADQKVEGYLKVSLRVLGEKFKNKLDDLFVLRAVGDSMNRAEVNGKTIEDGDYVIAEKTEGLPVNGDYVVSVIDGLANIKRIFIDKRNDQIILNSESSLELSPIYIHTDDYSDYLVCGKVIDVMKRPDELSLMRDASAKDVLKNLGPISKEEVSYYEGLK